MNIRPQAVGVDDFRADYRKGTAEFRTPPKSSPTRAVESSDTDARIERDPRTVCEERRTENRYVTTRLDQGSGVRGKTEYRPSLCPAKVRNEVRNLHR